MRLPGSRGLSWVWSGVVLAVVATLGVACGPPKECDRCPDVSGTWAATTEDLVSESKQSCHPWRSPFALRSEDILVVQSGSALRMIVAGDAFTGTLLADNSFRVVNQADVTHHFWDVVSRRFDLPQSHTHTIIQAISGALNPSAGTIAGKFHVAEAIPEASKCCCSSSAALSAMKRQ